MFESIGNFLKKMVKPENKELCSKDDAKERLHLVLMQDRANVSADFLELMKQEIIDVIKKYIVVDENSIDVRLTNKQNEDGTNGAPALYANIPIINIKNDMKVEKIKEFDGVNFNRKLEEVKKEEEKQEKIEEDMKEMVYGIEENKPEETENKTEIEENTSDLEKSISEISDIKEDEDRIDEDKKEDNQVEETDEDEEEDDDDDVTFDDLLKAAEEEDKQEAKNKKVNKKG